VKALARGAIHFYQRYLRQLHNRQCIYTPSCSNYGLQAIERLGAVQGCVVTYRRICRCNGALYLGGHDPL
jgi:putative membrane protein insertion efficiency factor